MQRNSVEIKVWLMRRSIKMEDIRRVLGYRNPKTVWATVEGRTNNRRVLSWLLSHGCPAEYLALPDDMRS